MIKATLSALLYLALIVGVALAFAGIQGPLWCAIAAFFVALPFLKPRSAP